MKNIIKTTKDQQGHKVINEYAPLINKLVKEIHFYPNGKTIKMIREYYEDSDPKKQITYREDNALQTIIKHDFLNGHVTKTIYHPDGKTIKKQLTKKCQYQNNDFDYDCDYDGFYNHDAFTLMETFDDWNNENYWQDAKTIEDLFWDFDVNNDE